MVYRQPKKGDFNLNQSNYIGSIHHTSCFIIAAEAAHTISRYSCPLAVAADIEGRVYVEHLNDVSDDDIVGVYDNSLSISGLEKVIVEDLLHVQYVRFSKPRKRRSAQNHARAT